MKLFCLLFNCTQI